MSFHKSDESLIGSLCDGDVSALESLYDRYSSLLYSVALRILGDTGSAEEVIQDSFLQVWRKAGQFDSARGSLIGWLLTITRHRSISRVRQRRNEYSLGETLGDSQLILRRDDSPTALEQTIARQLISAALAGLPNAQQQAVMLAYFDGMTCAEIADRTDVPLGTIKGRIRNALATMRITLSGGRLNDPGEMRIDGSTGTLASILITEQLFSRPCRNRAPQQEEAALQALTKIVADHPAELIDAFLQLSIDLCNAGTAGLSLLETNSAGERVFRWINLAGELRNHVGGSTPRHFSPCGVTLDRKSAQLFAYPGRYFTYFNEVTTPIVEGLVIPIRVSSKIEGTVWIISHSDEVSFDSEDARVMTSLSEFVGCALAVS